jgi:hypothetical protein
VHYFNPILSKIGTYQQMLTKLPSIKGKGKGKGKGKVPVLN